MSENSDGKSIDAQVLLEYYKEQLAHGRHVEVQRSTVAGIALGVSGGIIGELAKKSKLTREELPYTVMLLAVGTVAWLLTAKLYERFRLHEETAKLARNKLEPSLAEFRLHAQAVIKEKYPLMFRIKLHLLWNLLFGMISLFGLIATVICLLP